MYVEFEEKQFEVKMNAELMFCKRIYSPGQVLENIVGFDSAIFTKNKRFWKMFPEYFDVLYKFFHRYLDGVYLEQSFWKELQNEIDEFPKIKYNLIIQYKRPKYLSNKRASEWNSFNEPYFRYDLMKHQQFALEKLENEMKNKCLALYASPAFNSKKELWDNSLNGKLIEKTNFCLVSKLNSHEKYTYTEGGRKGIAFSEPEEIEKLSFDKLIENVNNYNEESNSNIIYNLSQAARNIIIFQIGEMKYNEYLQENGIENGIFRALYDIRLFEYIFNCEVKYAY
jgi:hypothetical protein